MSDHEHDDEGNCVPSSGTFYATELPAWKFSAWSVVGILATGAGAIFSVTGQVISQTANLLAREFEAQANWKRQSHDLTQAQREYDARQAEDAELLRRMVEGDAP